MTPIDFQVTCSKVKVNIFWPLHLNNTKLQGLHPISRWSLFIFRSHVQRSRSNYSFETSVLSTLYILIPWLLASYRFCFYREDKPEFAPWGAKMFLKHFLFYFPIKSIILKTKLFCKKVTLLQPRYRVLNTPAISSKERFMQASLTCWNVEYNALWLEIVHTRYFIVAILKSETKVWSKGPFWLDKNAQHAPPWVTNQILLNNNHLAELMFTWSPTGDGERNET